MALSLKYKWELNWKRWNSPPILCKRAGWVQDYQTSWQEQRGIVNSERERFYTTDEFEQQKSRTDTECHMSLKQEKTSMSKNAKSRDGCCFYKKLRDYSAMISEV